MTLQELNGFISPKTKKRIVLENQKDTIHQLHKKLTLLKKVHFSNFSHYSFKRFSVLLIGSTLMFLAIYMLFNPNFFLDNEFIRDEYILKQHNEYYKLTNKTISESMIDLSISNTTFNIQNFSNNLNQSIENTLHKDLISSSRVIAMLLFIIAIISLYICYLYSKLTQKNNIIHDATIISQQIIKDYDQAIEEENFELELHKSFLKKDRSSIDTYI